MLKRILRASRHLAASKLAAILEGISTSCILNVCVEDDSVWAQDSLPVKAGGLGVKRASQLVPSAFLASAAGCSKLVNQNSSLTHAGLP